VIPRRWVPTALWAALILVLTSVPGDSVPDGPAGLDKLVHLGLYAVLGALATRALFERAPGASLRSLARLLLAIACFALVDEAHQQLIPGRSADARDVLADVAGAAVAIALTAAALSRREPTT
jgi:VanZ family protein